MTYKWPLSYRGSSKKNLKKKQLLRWPFYVKYFSY